MKKSIFLMLFSLCILGTACNRQDKDPRSFTDADIQELKVKIEKDALWKEYVSIMHNSINLVTSKNLYVNEALYKNPPEIASKLAKVKSNDEVRQVLLSSGYTEANTDSMIKWLDCVKNLQQKFPEMTQVDQQKLNLQVPPIDDNEYPFNALKNPKDFSDKMKKMKESRSK